MSALLQLDKATIRFGGLTAVSELDLQIGHNELVGLIGPNGAGKTTVFNLVTGVYQPTSGAISFDGESTAKSKLHQLTQRGIARTFQNIRLFRSMTVFDNVRTAARLHCPRGVRNALWRGRSFHDGEKKIADEVTELLKIFGLGKIHEELVKSLPLDGPQRLTNTRDQLAKFLSYGDQRRLEIVRALATKPKLLLLDEPAAGMNASEKIELMRLIQFIKDKFQISVLLVEHDMQVVMGICERIAVLDYGIKIAEGKPDEIRKNPKVIEAYLGQELKT
jgi:branched-chain amino acid transport system ATP-binding protein